MGRTSITMPSMVGIVGRSPAVDEKVMFLSVCLFFVTLWKDEVCDNGNDMKQCNFQNSYGVVAYRKVFSCAPIFNFFCGPPKFSLRGIFIRKIATFRDFWGCMLTFLKPGRWNLVWGSDSGLPPQAKCYKNRLRGIPFWQIYAKNYQFWGL